MYDAKKDFKELFGFRVNKSYMYIAAYIISLPLSPFRSLNQAIYAGNSSLQEKIIHFLASLLLISIKNVLDVKFYMYSIG